MLGDIRRNNPLEAGGKSEGGKNTKNQPKIKFLVLPPLPRGSPKITPINLFQENAVSHLPGGGQWPSLHNSLTPAHTDMSQLIVNMGKKFLRVA